VPADHGVRLDDDERGAPARPGTREPRAEQAVRGREARSPGRAREHSELLPQGEVLQGDVAPRAYGAAQEAAGEPKVSEQGAASFKTDAVRLARTPSSVNQSDSDEILGPHRTSNVDTVPLISVPTLYWGTHRMLHNLFADPSQAEKADALAHKLMDGA
jgi:hypothetical protein